MSSLGLQPVYLKIAEKWLENDMKCFINLIYNIEIIICIDAMNSSRIKLHIIFSKAGTYTHHTVGL